MTASLPNYPALLPLPGAHASSRGGCRMRVPRSTDADPAPDPECNLAALQELTQIERLFVDDQRARQIIEGLYEGLSPEEICSRYDMSKPNTIRRAGACGASCLKKV